MNDSLLTNLRNEFTPEYREFVESDFTDEAAMVLGQPIGLTEQQITILRNGFMLYLHFVLSEEDLVRFLTTEAVIMPEVSGELVRVFKSTLPLELTASHNSTVRQFRSEPAKISAIDEIAEMEAALARIPNVRTMATDMQQVQASGSGEYTSNQAALLKRRDSESDADEARWNSTSPY